MAKNNENTSMLKAEDPNAQATGTISTVSPDSGASNTEAESSTDTTTSNTSGALAAKSTSDDSAPEEGLLDVEAVILEAETRFKTALTKMKDLAARLEVDVSHEFADIEKHLELLAG